MREIETVVEIEVPPGRVWQELTDFAAYEEWNPFVIEASGEAAEGERLALRLRPPGGSAMKFRPRVIRAEEGRELRWLGHLGVPGIFDGEHYFELEETAAGGTKLTHGELFRGITVPLFGGVLKKSEKGFGLMNQALKERCEARP